jgi:hypothetical protein
MQTLPSAVSGPFVGQSGPLVSLPGRASLPWPRQGA